MPKKVEKYYLITDKKGMAGKIRKLLNDHWYRVSGEYHKSGGRSGDLGEEVAEFDEYVSPCEEGSAQLYTVKDDSVNGYAELISVLLKLPGKSEERSELVSFLEKNHFVSDHTSFKERPFGYKSFMDYLDSEHSHQSPFAKE